MASAAVDEAKGRIQKAKQDANDLSKTNDDLKKELEKKQKALEKEKSKPKDEQNQGVIEGLTSDILGISDKLKALKEALEALAGALKEMQPVLEGLEKLGEELAKDVLDLLKEVLKTLEGLIKDVTDILKSILKLLKVLLIVPLILQKIFNVSPLDAVLVQPLGELSLDSLLTADERSVRALNERGIFVLRELAGADLVGLQRCGINVERVAVLKQHAEQIVKPFPPAFLTLIEEFDLSLPAVASQADADFIQPRRRVREIRADILGRAVLLRPGALDDIRVSDLIDIVVPSGFSLDCPSTWAVGR